MKAIYKFVLSNTYSPLESIFVSDKKYINYLIDNSITLYFGEVDGKYSEVEETMSKENFTEITDNSEIIDVFEKYNLATGINPLDCVHKIIYNGDGEYGEETWLDYLKNILNESK